MRVGLAQLYSKKNPAPQTHMHEKNTGKYWKRIFRPEIILFIFHANFVAACSLPQKKETQREVPCVNDAPDFHKASVVITCNGCLQETT